MPILFKHVFTYRDKEFTVAADLHDADIVKDQDQLHITINAKARVLPDGLLVDEDVELVVDFPAVSVKVIYRGETVATVSLDDPLTDGADWVINGIATVGNAGPVDYELATYAFEKGISFIPSDPYLGCLVKGAVSTLVGQIIRCWGSSREGITISERPRQIAGCLREHGTHMGFTFIARVLRCAAFLGLPQIF